LLNRRNFSRKYKLVRGVKIGQFSPTFPCDGLAFFLVEPQNRGFTPTAEEVADARWVLEEYRSLQRDGQLWKEVNGRVIDMYEARRAEELLEWAQLVAERDAEKADAVARAKAAEPPSRPLPPGGGSRS